MKNFSEENIDTLKTNKDRVMEIIRSSTGFDDITIQKIYESKKIDNVPNVDIVNEITAIAQPRSQIELKSFFGSFVDGISKLTTTNTLESKAGITKAIVKAIEDFSTLGDIDTYNLLSIINQLIFIKDSKKDFSKELNLLKIGSAEKEYGILFESINFTNIEDQNKSTLFLFESLRNILMKNNKRWGNAYHIQNTYNAMMSYFDNEIKEIMLNETMVSIDNSYHIDLLNDFLSCNVSPINKNINGVKHLISDLQTVIFDMILIVDNHIMLNDTALNLIAKQTFNDYDIASSALLTEIASSRLTSKILINCNSDANDYDKFLAKPDNNFKKKCSSSIDKNKLKYDLWLLNNKAIVDMVNFIKSASSEFNLKIRPAMRQYVTKTYEIVSKIDKANFELNKMNRNRR